jgi:hypothetical protein
MRLVKKLASMAEMENTYKSLVERPETWPRFKWEYNIKVVVKRV